jgi:hypothetical protein
MYRSKGVWKFVVKLWCIKTINGHLKLVPAATENVKRLQIVGYKLYQYPHVTRSQNMSAR